MNISTRSFPVNLSRAFLCLLVGSGLLVNSCMKLPALGKVKSKALVEEFYRGEGKMLYFVRPINFKAKKTKNCRLLVDYTINTEPDSSKRVKCTFSIHAKYPVKRVNSFSCQSGEHGFTTQQVEKFHLELKGKTWESRHAVDMDYASFESMFSEENPHKISLNYSYPDGNVQDDFVNPRRWSNFRRQIEVKILMPIKMGD